MYYCCGITDTGTVRNHNEDAFLINKIVMSKAQLETPLKAPFIAAVADGVGGEKSGEVASRLALELLTSMKINKKTDYEKKVLNIHSYLKRYGIAHDNLNMQTTLCAVAVDSDENAVIINSGDSRLYRYRGGKIKQLSVDQSLVQMLYEQGHITIEQKRTHAQKNVIFPVLGNINTEPAIDVTPIEGGFIHGDIIIICSDGLSDYLTTSEFEDTLALPQNFPKRLQRLVSIAKENKSNDNITVVGITAC